MRAALLLCAAGLCAEARDLPIDGNLVRTDRFTQFELRDHRIELKSGVVLFHLADSGAPPVEIVTPNVVVQPFFMGDYRIEVTRFGQTVITPYGGDLRVEAPQGAQWIVPGEKMIVRGTAADPEFRVVSAVSRWRRLLDLAGAAHIGAGAVSGGGSSDEAAHHDSSRNASAARPGSSKTDSGKEAPAHHANDSSARSSTATRGK